MSSTWSMFHENVLDKTYICMLSLSDRRNTHLIDLINRWKELPQYVNGCTGKTQILMKVRLSEHKSKGGLIVKELVCLHWLIYHVFSYMCDCGTIRNRFGHIQQHTRIYYDLISFR